MEDFGSKYSKFPLSAAGLGWSLYPRVIDQFSTFSILCLTLVAVSFFVDRATGDIYKPASFRAPAKGVRGNIFKSDTWKKYDVHGGWLYRYR